MLWGHTACRQGRVPQLLASWWAAAAAGAAIAGTVTGTVTPVRAEVPMAVPSPVMVGMAVVTTRAGAAAMPAPMPTAAVLTPATAAGIHPCWDRGVLRARGPGVMRRAGGAAVVAVWASTFSLPRTLAAQVSVGVGETQRVLVLPGWMTCPAVLLLLSPPPPAVFRKLNRVGCMLRLPGLPACLFRWPLGCGLSSRVPPGVRRRGCTLRLPGAVMRLPLTQGPVAYGMAGR